MNTMNRLTGKLQIVMLGLIFMSTMLVGPKFSQRKPHQKQVQSLSINYLVIQ